MFPKYQLIVDAVAKYNRQRRFRKRKESYTKQLEKKVTELEGISAGLKLELAKLSEAAAQPRGDGAEDVPLQCPRCGPETNRKLELSANARRVAVASVKGEARWEAAATTTTTIGPGVKRGLCRIR